jgi:hypothetical protein
MLLDGFYAFHVSEPTYDISNKFHVWKGRKVIMEELPVKTVTRDGNYLFRRLSILQKNEYQAESGTKFCIISECIIIQPPTAVVGHVDSERSIFASCNNQCYYPLKFQWGLC